MLKTIVSYMRGIVSDLETLPQLFGQMKKAIKERDLKEIENLFDKIVKKSGVAIPKWEPSKKDLELQAAFLTLLDTIGHHDKDIEKLEDEDINWGGKFDLYIHNADDKKVTPEILKELEAVAKLLNAAVIAPSKGDSFNPSEHSAYSEENSDIPKAKVIRCHSYGWKNTAQGVRLKAKVILSRGR